MGHARCSEHCAGIDVATLAKLAQALGSEARELRPGEPLAVPATLSELTVSRFEQLDGEAWEVLLFVAALARPTVEVVTEAAGERASVALEAGAAAGLIEADGSRLRFTHPLLASAHYGAASPDDRRRVHRRLAQVVTDVEERGRHLGAVATGPDEEVAAALDRAAAAARSRGAVARLSRSDVRVPSHAGVCMRVRWWSTSMR